MPKNTCKFGVMDSRSLRRSLSSPRRRSLVGRIHRSPNPLRLSPRSHLSVRHSISPSYLGLQGDELHRFGRPIDPNARSGPIQGAQPAPAARAQTSAERLAEIRAGAPERGRQLLENLSANARAMPAEDLLQSYQNVLNNSRAMPSRQIQNIANARAMPVAQGPLTHPPPIGPNALIQPTPIDRSIWIQQQVEAEQAHAIRSARASNSVFDAMDITIPIFVESSFNDPNPFHAQPAASAAQAAASAAQAAASAAQAAASVAQAAASAAQAAASVDQEDMDTAIPIFVQDMNPVLYAQPAASAHQLSLPRHIPGAGAAMFGRR